jgi:hypothetical protein
MNRSLTATSTSAKGPVFCEVSGVLSLSLHRDGTITGSSDTFAISAWDISGNPLPCERDQTTKHVLTGTHQAGKLSLTIQDNRGTIEGTYSDTAASGAGTLTVTKTASNSGKVEVSSTFSFTAVR